MPTRVKRPSILLKLSIAAGLVAFQGYLGYHLLTGTFGLESQKDMLAEIDVLKARQASLSTEIEAYRHRISLFDPQKLDPDIITERSRELLGLVHPDDIIVVPESNN